MFPVQCRRSNAALAALMIALLAATAYGQTPTTEPAPAATTVQIYGADIHDAEGKEPGAPPSIAIVAARNGSFSGKVMLTSTGPIQGLRATVSDLTQGDATIPAAQAAVRFGVEWDKSFQGRTRPKGPDMLLDAAPAELPAGTVAVWVTVRPPATAKPGKYAGTLTVEIQGQAATKVPVTVDVQDWTLPETQDWRTWIEIIQSPDTLAIEYGVPFWSEAHWQLIEQSLKLIGQTGCRTVYLPLICQTNQGNSQTMVRWIKKGDGYEHDFSVLDRYLDAAEKNLGRPKAVVFYMWDVLLSTPPDEMIAPQENDSEWSKGEKARLRARVEQVRQGVPVTGLDPTTGQTETIRLPLYREPAAKALWTPVWQGLRERIQERGYEKISYLGTLSDWVPTAEDLKVLHELSGDLTWMSTSHHLRDVLTGKGLGKNRGVPVGIASVALDFRFTINPDLDRTYGWKLPYLHLHCWQTPRNFFNVRSLSTIRQEAECNITGTQRGIGRIGGDFWPAIKSRSGRREGTVTDRYPEAYWHSLSLGDFLLAPGPRGPVGTARFEVFREGLQECEARLAIEAVLTDEALKARLPGDLAARAQKLLDDRQRYLWVAKGASPEDLQLKDFYNKFWDLWLKKWDSAKGNQWFIGSGWQQRTAALFAMAGEVQKALAAK